MASELAKVLKEALEKLEGHEETKAKPERLPLETLAEHQKWLRQAKAVISKVSGIKPEAREYVTKLLDNQITWLQRRIDWRQSKESK